MNTANPKPGLVSDVTQSAKNIAVSVAKQVAEESTEIYKQAAAQITGTEQGPSGQTEMSAGSGDPNSEAIQNEAAMSARDKVRSQRLIAALETELKEIENTKKQKSMIQTQQQEQVADRSPWPTSKPLEETVQKRGRKMDSGKKSQIQKQQTQTERPLPPSG